MLKIGRCPQFPTEMVMELNNLEAQILRFLEAHQGRDFSISRERLVEKINGALWSTGPQLHGVTPLGVSERKIRATIKHLTTQHGVAIGSGPKGYFIAETAEEIEEVCKYYDGYGLSSLFVSSRLRKIEMRDYLGQLSMRFAPPSAGQGG